MRKVYALHIDGKEHMTRQTADKMRALLTACCGQRMVIPDTN